MAARSGREKAYEFLKGEVLPDPAAQGQFISEQDLASRIGVSRTPIREALLMLAAEELVQLVPNRGAYIAPLTGRDLSELIELRGMMERFAAEKTIAGDGVPVERMRATLKQQAELADPAQAKEFIELDTAFHTHLIDAAGNAMLSKAYAGLRDRQLRAGLVALFACPNRQHAVCEEHQAIVDGLAARDLAATHAAIDHHLGTTLKLQLTS
ncbi:GntR family transcriptional regulator [Amycolatopsis albispora]|uniref:GntR family transcriptional regulator n=1 Tax=Amycolatopsis albispora TaxID=1804986 RepID=A0A344LCD0_9PSEU|nr:GntR family transcriptional regulator [Amycolatopsis albispora]AXB45704.1 GntR family transcriptional regulator [Amycolatopsis albispora]